MDIRSIILQIMNIISHLPNPITKREWPSSFSLAKTKKPWNVEMIWRVWLVSQTRRLYKKKLEIQNLHFVFSDCKIPSNIIWDEKYKREFSFTLHYLQTQAQL